MNGGCSFRTVVALTCPNCGAVMLPTGRIELLIRYFKCENCGYIDGIVKEGAAM